MVSDWRGRRVLVTGHTGFKGGWLVMWLRTLGASVHGYALDPPTTPSMYEVMRIRSIMASDARGDVADLAQLLAVFSDVRPEVVFHLAAQPLVRESYRAPLVTLTTNIMGTAHVLEVVRRTASVRAVVLVTTDKVYENREWAHPYREVDALGGGDPYSASKAAAEIVAASYRASFFEGPVGSAARIATVRAGNVVGGGDWAAERLVPDCLRAFAEKRPVQLRHPGAVRSWQHVLEPLSGYLSLAGHLLDADGDRHSTAWNFGPEAGGDATVGGVASKLAQLWGKDATVSQAATAENSPEAGILRLDCTRARVLLGWRPRWSLNEALARTVDWYRAWQDGTEMTTFSEAQIRAYSERTGHD